MEIKWMLAYFLISSSPVFGNARKVETSAGKAPATPKQLASSNEALAQMKAAATTSMQAKQKEASRKTAPPSQPPATRPSTDPIICDLENNKSGLALPSLQCTLRELPKNLADNMNKYMGNGAKNVSHLLKEICDSMKVNENPKFMSNYTKDDNDMIRDTSTLCRIRHTTKSECEIPKLIQVKNAPLPRYTFLFILT
uniref:Putative salivary secreted peptide n=1 Tax=Ixodes ricinus TaxID=34613 RepID=V5GWX1_IXORI